MPGFVGKQRVPVTLTELNPETGQLETNTIYIKDKMGFGARNRVSGSVARSVSENASGGVDVDVNFGQGNVALMQENILDWEGPQFVNERGKRIPVTKQAIEDLDPEWELVDMTLKAISARNLVKKPTEDDPRTQAELEQEQVKNSEAAGAESYAAATSPLGALTSR